MISKLTAVIRGLVYLALLSLFVPPAAAGSQSVPLEFTPQGLIIVPGLLGDSIPARFILDTGAGCHLLSRQVFHRLSPMPLGHYTGFQINGERQEQQLYEIPALSVGGSLQVAAPVAVMAGLDSSGVDGVLSASFFRNRVLTLDFVGRRLIIEDSLSLRQRLIEGEIVPVKILDDRGKVMKIFFDVTAPPDGVLECLFDTGTGTTFDERFLKTLKVMEAQQWMGIDAQGGKQMAWSGKLEYIALATAKGVGLDQAPVAFMPQMIYDGQIGWNFFTGRVVTFNLPDQYVIIKKQ